MIVSYDPQSQVDSQEPNLHSRCKLDEPEPMANDRWSCDSFSGTLDDSQSLPAAVAPLVYIDDRRQFKDMMDHEKTESQSEENKTSKKLDKIKEALAAYNDYLDRRARARYVGHFLF